MSILRSGKTSTFLKTIVSFLFYIIVMSQLNKNQLKYTKKCVIIRVYDGCILYIHIYVCLVCLTFCLPSTGLKQSYTVDDMKKRLRPVESRAITTKA